MYTGELSPADGRRPFSFMARTLKKKNFLNSMMIILPVEMLRMSPMSLVVSLENLLAIVRAGFLFRFKSNMTILSHSSVLESMISGS